MTSTTEPAAARICPCGVSFPPDRAPQARYHSDACANAHRQRAFRARSESHGERLLRRQLESASQDEARQRWRELSPTDRHSLLDAGGLLLGEAALAAVLGFAEPEFVLEAA
jgi:hypothetical protein